MDIDQGTGDISQVMRQNDTLHGYYAFQRDSRGEPTLQGNTVPGFGDTRQSHRQILTVNETHVVSARLVNEFRIGFNRIKIDFMPNALLNPADYGIDNGVTTDLGLPQISIAGLGLNFGGPSTFPQGRADTTYVLSDTATYLYKQHAIKVGGEFRSFDTNAYNSDTGAFQFASVADFQRGIGNNFVQTLGDRPSDVTQRAFSLFVQDQLKLASNFTLEAGVRYDLNLAPSDSMDRFVVFDAATDSLVQVGTTGRDQIYPNDNEIVPRFGIVWDPVRRRPHVRARRVCGDGRPARHQRRDADRVEPAAGDAAHLRRPHPARGRARDGDRGRARAELRQPRLPGRTPPDVERQHRATAGTTDGA